MTQIKQIYAALQKVITKGGYLLLLLLSSVVIFSLFIVIPILTTPGNTLAFQLSLLAPQNYVLMIFLALLAGVNMAFQMYILRNGNKSCSRPQTAFQGFISSVSGIFGAMVGTAACVSCLAALFALVGLGFGSVVFVLKNQIYFLAAAIGTMAISLYFAAKKINSACS